MALTCARRAGQPHTPSFPSRCSMCLFCGSRRTVWLRRVGRRRRPPTALYGLAAANLQPLSSRSFCCRHRGRWIHASCMTGCLVMQKRMTPHAVPVQYTFHAWRLVSTALLDAQAARQAGSRCYAALAVRVPIPNSHNRAAQTRIGIVFVLGVACRCGQMIFLMQSTWRVDTTTSMCFSGKSASIC